MENHPIPQNVTGFQFKLIGSMTVKQFAYLAAGAIVGWLIFILPLSSLIRLPITLFSVGLGAALAFVPIEGRPMDAMLFSFIKAVFAHNQYVYEKPQVGVAHAAPSLMPQPQVPQPLQPTPPREQAKQLSESLRKVKEEVSEKLEQVKRAAGQTKQAEGKEKTHEEVLTLEKKLEDILQEKGLLEAKLATINQELARVQPLPVFTPTVASPPKETKLVRKIPPGLSPKAFGLPIIADVANLLAGVVKDPRSGVLQGILVEVKDKEGNPVRAFRTNSLGQFQAATQLANGTYTIVFEDPKGVHQFDAVEITADGTAIPPLEVFSTDERERLRRELFGT